MTRIAKIMAAAVLAGGLAAPAAAQVYGQPYPQTYPGQPYAYQGYNGYVRVTAITDVSRRSNGRVRVRGLLDTARGGYGRGGGADLSFRCDVDYAGRVYNVDLDRNGGYRRY